MVMRRGGHRFLGGGRDGTVSRRVAAALTLASGAFCGVRLDARGRADEWGREAGGLSLLLIPTE